MGSEEDWYLRMSHARSDYYEKFEVHARAAADVLAALDARNSALTEYWDCEAMWLLERHNELARQW